MNAQSLPALLTRGRVMEITGWSERRFKEQLRKHPNLAIRDKKREWWRVRTRELLKLL